MNKQTHASVSSRKRRKNLHKTLDGVNVMTSQKYFIMYM